METKLNVVNGLIEITVLQTLTNVQLEKFENHELYPKIEAAAKDFQLNWSIDVKGNVATLVTSSTTSSNILKGRMVAVEKNSLNFKFAVEKMSVPEQLPVKKEEDLVKSVSDYDFIKTIVDTWDETDEFPQTVGFVIMASSRDCPILRIPVGFIPQKLAKELCESYLKVHNDD